MSFDLTNKNISKTFQNLLQRTGSDNSVYDLEGNAIGDLKISGSLFAQSYVVSSSVTVQEFVFNSGSTIFGDTSDDIHQFTGSLDIHDGGITASTDIYLDNYLDTAIRFIDGTGGGNNNFLDYRRWASSATAGKEITNTTGIIKFESKGDSNGLVLSGSSVGIGTTSPTKELEVDGDISGSRLFLNSGTSDTVATFKSSDSTARIEITDDNTTNYIVSNTNSDSTLLSLGANNSTHAENLNISSSGAVGIGTTSPGELLEVDGNIRLGDGGQRNIIGPTNENLGIFSNPNGADEGIIFSTDNGSTTEMIILNGGNVGIGTASPTSLLHLSSSADYSLIFDKAGEETYKFTHGSSGLFIQNDGTNQLAFIQDHDIRIYNDGGNETVVFRNSGNVGIGTTSPNEALHVQSDSNQLAQFTSTDNRALIEISDNDTFGYIVAEDTRFQMGGTSSLSANNLTVRTDSGNVGIGTTSPSKKLEVAGDISASGDLYLDANKNIYLNAPSTADNFITYRNASDDIKIKTQDVYFDVNGVGIGTSTPAELLTVHGNISASHGTGSFGKVYVDDGTEALPSIAFGLSGQEDNGIYRRSNNTIGFSTGGDGMMTVNPSGVTIGSNHVANNLTPSDNGLLVQGDIKTEGDIIAQRYIVSSSVTHLTQSFSSGSTIFGDTPDDIHQFTGSLDISGSMFVSSSGIVGIGRGFTTSIPKNGLHITGSDGTTSGIRQSRAGSKIWNQEIDSSGRLQWGYRSTEAGSRTTTFTLDDTNKVGIGTGAPDAFLHILGGDEDTLKLDASTGEPAIFFAQSDNNKWEMRAGSDHFGLYDYTLANWQFYINDGLVGIGHSNPTLGRLHVSGSGTNPNYSILSQTTGSINYMKFANSTTGITSGDGFDIGASGTTAYLINRENAAMEFYTNAAFRMRITGTGNVGIGTTSPTVSLETTGSILASGSISSSNRIISRDNYTATLFHGTSGGPSLKFGSKTDEDAYMDLAAVGGINKLDTKDRDFHLMGTNTTTGFYFQESTGNVGIGTTAPTKPLQVEGDISASGDLFVDDLRSGNSRGFDFFTLGGSAAQINIGQLAMSASYTAGNTAVEAMNTTNAAMFGGDVSVGPHGNGKLGIGKLIPTEALEVEGDISASGDLHIGVHGSIRNVSGNLTIRPEGDLKLGSDSTDNILIGRTDVGTTTIQSPVGLLVSGSGHITASGDISASGALMGNDLIIEDAGGVSFDIKSTSGDSFMRFIDGGTSKFSLGFDNGLGKFAISTGSGLSNNHAVTIENNGRVGIGTTSPSNLFQVESSGTDIAVFKTANDAPIRVESTDGTTGITFKDDDAEQQLYYRGDRNIFYIESPTKLGLGTNDPTETLDVRGSASFSGHITASGNISASGKLISADLDVDGGKIVTAGSVGLKVNMTDDHFESGSLQVWSPNTTENTRMIMGVTSESNASSGRGSFINTTYSTGGTFALRFLQAGVEKMRIDHGGNVGIGTTSPDEKLEVIGNISASGTIIASQFNDDGTNLNVPDYVFETNYVLKSLSDVEKHISESKHLPNIPSMEDVDSWSELSYGDRDMKLLEKIEELTLYIISLQKQINELKNSK